MSSPGTAQKPANIEISEKEPVANKNAKETLRNKVSQQPQNASQKNASPKQAVDEEAIRLRAYEIYAGRGFHDGNHAADWLEAEEQLRKQK